MSRFRPCHVSKTDTKPHKHWRKRQKQNPCYTKWLGRNKSSFDPKKNEGLPSLLAVVAFLVPLGSFSGPVGRRVPLSPCYLASDHCLFLCLILWFSDCKTPASTAAITSTAASNSSSVIPAFLASARRHSTHGSHSRIIATASPISMLSRSVKHSTAWASW